FGKEFRWGFCEKVKVHIIHFQSQMGPVTGEGHQVARFALERAGASVQNGLSISKLLFPGCSQLPDPNVSVTDGISMILERDGLLLWMLAAGRSLQPRGGPGQFDVILDQHAVLENSHAGGGEKLSVVFKPRRGIDNVVSLPFSGGTADVHQWGILAVD